MNKFVKQLLILGSVTFMTTFAATAVEGSIPKNSHSAEYWNQVSIDYDKTIRNWVKDYDEFLENMVRCIPNNKRGQVLKILDLGSGTGNVTQEILKSFPNAEVSCVDLSDSALNVCKEKFANNNLVTINSDIRSKKIYQKSKYDLVVSSLAIHHITDKEKLELYKSIFKCLKKDGCVIIGETTECEDPRISKQIDGEEFTEHDSIPCSVYKQLKIFEKAGFSGIDCIWKKDNYAVFYAKK